MSYFINKKTGEIITASSIKEASKKVTANFLYAKEKAKVIPKISALVKEIAKEYGFEVKKDAKKMGDADYFEWYLIKGKHGTTCDAKIDITLGVYLRFNAFNCRTFAEVTKANIASFETFKKYLTNTCSQLFKKTKVTASTDYDFIDATDNMDNSWLCQGQNKDAVEKLYELESDEVPMHTSFHELIQLNFDGELPEEILELVNDRRQFKILKKSDNRKLREQFEQLQKIFTDKGIDLTGDMGFEFQDSSTAPLYIDHFCITLYEGEKNEKNYRLVCANEKFYFSDYDEGENESKELTFEEAKKKCSELAEEIKSKQSVACTQVFAYVDDVVKNLDSRTIEAYDSLNKRFASKGKLDSQDLADSISMIVDNTKSLYDQLLNNKHSMTSIVWQALNIVVNKHLEFTECSKHSLSSEQLKKWFKANDTTFEEALKPAVKKVQKLKDDYLEDLRKNS